MRQEDLKITPEIERYANALERTGMPEREVARAFFYAGAYGLDSLSGDGDGCVRFKEPSCRNWDCLNPEHQRLVKE
jgi:hypothetical protein